MSILIFQSNSCFSSSSSFCSCSSWPWSSNCSVVIHLNDLSLGRGHNKRILPLQPGDFYLCLAPIADENHQQKNQREIGRVENRRSVGLELRYYDRIGDDFTRKTVDFERLVEKISRSNAFLDFPADWIDRFDLKNCLLLDVQSYLIERRPLTSDGCLSLSHSETAPAVVPANAMNIFCPFNSSVSTSSSSSRMNHRWWSPKELTAIRTDLLSTNIVVFIGADEDRSAIVELHPSKANLVANFGAEDLARVLGYLYSVYSRTGNETKSHKKSPEIGPLSSSLLLIVDCRTSENWPQISKTIVLFWKAICLLLQWVPESVRRLLWIEFKSGTEMEKIIIGDEQTKAQCVINESISLDELHRRISVTDLTTIFNGERTLCGSEFVRFREQFESFLKYSRSLGELFTDLHQELHRVSTQDLWTIDLIELNEMAKTLVEKKSIIESTECYRFIRDKGDSVLSAFATDYPNIHSFGVQYNEKVSGFYKELRKIMGKVPTEIDKRLAIIGNNIDAKEFICKADEYLSWLDSVALPTARRHANQPSSVSLIRLKLRDRQFERFFESAKKRLQQAEQLLLDGEWAKEPDEDLDERQRRRLTSVWNGLLEKVDHTQTLVKLVREKLADNLVCYNMLDKVYDWALKNAKWSSQLRLLISKAADCRSTGADELKTLLSAVTVQLDSYPCEELDQLPCYSAKLVNEQIGTETKLLSTKCSSALSVLEKHKLELERLIDEYDSNSVQCIGTVQCNGTFPSIPSRSVSPAATEYEQPVVRQRMGPISTESDESHHENANIADDGIRWRRRSSYAGSSTCSLEQVERAYEHRYRPSSRWSRRADNEEPFDDGQGGQEAAAISTHVITKDMTDQVISCMSANTLRKRITDRRASSSGPFPPPNPLALIRSGRPGSARYTVAKCGKPFRKLSESPNEWSSREVVDFGDFPSLVYQQHSSLSSLVSIGKDSEQGTAACWSSSAPLGRTDDDPIDGRLSTQWSPTELSEPSRSCRLSTPPPDSPPDQLMQTRVLNELVASEIEYVEALAYVMQHYVPQLNRDDLPRELRGQRATIFGNLEKVHNFHVDEFLPELMRLINDKTADDSLCLSVGRLFNRFRTSFHLYALYNKNKPKSDRLMAECGQVFFRTVQLSLGDRLDLASYLLKPVQRMGKYALLLHQLLRACSWTDQEAGQVLRRAEAMVQFQLRHGNDLLAMDLIVGCDVNLKEQGALLRHDEFTVWDGGGLHRKKSIRRVFLFEHLVLFAKPKCRKNHNNTTRGQSTTVLADTYQYKHSIQMSNCGLTERVRDSPVKFELWYRRNRSSSTLTLQAPNASMHDLWVSEISRILWRQAVKNRQLSLRERSSMGVGDRATCVDLHPSEDRIQDRAVDATLLSKSKLLVARFRNSFATLSSRDLRNTGKRPHSLVSLSNSSCTTASSNGSSLGSVVIRFNNATPESGICADLFPLDEETPEKFSQDTVPRSMAPPIPESPAISHVDSKVEV